VYYPRMSKTDQERFFLERVKKNGDCWIWQGGKRGKYGDFKYISHRCAAHRWAWEFYRGPIPKGLCILHSCDTPLCVNPAHLFVGTISDNTRDMIKKGRGAVCHQQGENNPGHVLSKSDVIEIKTAKGHIGQRALAKHFGVCVATIQHIQAGRTWTHVHVEMAARMRHRRGSENGRAKLTADQVDQIKERCKSRRQKDVAREFGVTQSTVSCIVRGATWR